MSRHAASADTNCGGVLDGRPAAQRLGLPRPVRRVAAGYAGRAGEELWCVKEAVLPAAVLHHTLHTADACKSDDRVPTTWAALTRLPSALAPSQSIGLVSRAREAGIRTNFLIGRSPAACCMPAWPECSPARSPDCKFLTSAPVPQPAAAAWLPHDGPQNCSNDRVHRHAHHGACSSTLP